MTAKLVEAPGPAGPLDSALERVPRWIAAVSGAGVLACLVAGQARFAAGLALGSGIALLGYWWLHRGLKAAFDSGQGRAPISVLVRLTLRYPVAVGAVLLFNYTGWLPARAVMAGLFAPFAGVLVECLVLGAQALRESRSRNQGEDLTTGVTGIR